MKKQTILSAAVAAVVTGGLALTAVQSTMAADDYTAPRNEWGQPDLRGVFNFSSNTPMQRNPEYGNRLFYTEEEVLERDRRVAEEAAASDGQSNQGGVGGYNRGWIEDLPQDVNLRTSIIVYPENGRLPARVPGAPMAFGGLGPDYDGERPVRVAVGGIGKDGPEDRGISERCLLGFNSVPPFTPSMYNNNVQLFQTEDHAVIFNEMIHEARIVRLQDEHIPESITQWTGDSVGYYEGDSLVVETRNFNYKSQTFFGTGVATNKTLIEKFTRTADDIVEYEFTVIDPLAFEDKFTGVVPMFRSEEVLYEYACHEGNYGMVNILQGQRVEDGTWDYDNNRAIRQ
ncbi:hypothetical protein QGM61_10040 [Pseudohongiella sp. SYSU M77423]|uniref:hypothetical protein n=1 Tax=Pseudohongiella sp. SYSU M77423 TaxID=3042312 RepID=UPI002480BA18|nr:hypothetical protein [Pseudohongiella sp. SYSU M77423]MDH7944157.1 hypothetical protein [Pseudohongiella sp. SYSU M77423]MEC8859363.1 hypothetical protein [Pseudomonadota bacterium]